MTDETSSLILEQLRLIRNEAAAFRRNTEDKLLGNQYAYYQPGTPGIPGQAGYGCVERSHGPHRNALGVHRAPS